MTSLSFAVDDDAFVRALHEAEVGIDHFIDAAALELRERVEEEAGNVSPRLGDGWKVESRGADRAVVAGEWWAHFVARGTKDHGPKSAPFLIFEVGGDTVVATFVRGLKANPFDQRAIEATESRVDDIFRRLVT